jgi:hypothetical protein
VWTDSWPSIAGIGCGLVCVGAGEEQARKVLALRGLRGVERQVGLVRGTRCPTGSCASRMVQEEQDEVVDMEPVHRWWPSQRTRQDRVDRPGAGGERLGGLDAWHGEAGPCTRGLVVWPQNHRRRVSRFGPQNRARGPDVTETISGCVGKLRGGRHAALSRCLCREDVKA